ncbi:hypothetical protein IWW38_002974 [Coemansia aciculifera]|uniref:Uncharacterized protein n=1 Tax=Coemansia aciculifera TaxID=417176 RepID=A0ACC1M2S0_9FUNG|nr:hypothetical protein IWW38_002974 [Coemansia aciculifera]
MDEHVHADELKSWDTEAQALDDNVRHLVAISAMASANRTSSIAAVAQRRLDQLAQTSEKAHFIQQTREAILKMSCLMGTPKSINALTSLMALVGPGSDLAQELTKIPSLRSQANYNYDQMRARGRELFDGIYGRHASTVEGKLRALYPDLAEVVMVDCYGRLLGETRYLDGRDTELCAIGSLVPLDVPSQLKSHCLGAARMGATEEMVQAALQLAKLICTKRP